MAQAFGTYQLYFAPVPSQSAALGVILYFFSFTPLFAALFLSSVARDHKHNWESYLDFLQILIVTGTIYLLFLGVPWGRLSEMELLSRRGITVNLRNLLLSTGFVVRALTTRSNQRRDLYMRVGLPMVLYSLFFWLGKRGVSEWSAYFGSWFDLASTVPFGLVAVLAAGWQEKPAEKEPYEASGYVPIVLAYLLTLTLPIIASGLLILRGHVSRPEVFLISAAAAAVVTCSFGRLALTHHRQKQTFELLQISERRYRSLFERNLAGVFRTKPDGTYLDCNEAYARMFGYASRQEVLSSNAVEMYPTAADREERLAVLRRHKTITSMETRMRRKDGSYIWVLHNVTLMEDEQGNEFTEGTIIDINERKLAQARILEWKNRFEAAVLASRQIMYDWNTRTDEVTFGGNLESMLGYSVEEIAGTPSRWREHIDPGDLERYNREVDRVQASGTEPLHIEYRVRKRDGSPLTVKEDGYFITDETGDGSHMVGFIADVSEQRTLEEKLRQSQKMEAIGSLAGGVAHDFNNLLTVIKGYSQMVLEDSGVEETIRTNVERIENAAERAASLTRHLLAFSRKQVLQPKVIDLNALMANLDIMLRRLIAENIVVVTVAARDLGAVRADPSQLEQVIMNLVVNARDAMPEGGKLTLETSNIDLDEAYARDHDGVRSGRYVMLAVSDTGVGMDAQTQSRIFEPFFTTKELGRGTGLGLSTVYGIVKQSGGHIWVYSEPGRGTTFKIYFARVEDPAEVAPLVVKPATTVRGTETILLVEDDPQVRELTHSVLTKCGYSVVVAENAQAVTRTCKQPGVDIQLLLTDVVMPGISGREVADQVSARWPNAQVLYMSGYTEDSILHHGVLDHETFFLPKPFTSSALTNKVREVLDQTATTWNSAGEVSPQ